MAVPPHSASLDTWGRVRGDRWGLITWYEYIERVQVGGPKVLVCSGWVSARYLRARPSQNYLGIARLPLPDDRAAWPGVRERRPGEWPKEAIHIGVLRGEPYRLPDGCTPTGQRKPF